MAVLNAWQRLDRFFPGRPFGDGSAGSTTISSDPNTRATASGTSGTTALTIGSAILSNGDFFMIHQTRGTGAGQWEINRASSGGGTTSITTQFNLSYTFGTGAQVIKFSLNSTVTLNGFTVENWRAAPSATLKGGVAVICGETSVTQSGAIVAAGGNAVTGSGNSGVGAGFRGGFGDFGNITPRSGRTGEGTAGDIAAGAGPNGNAGGGPVNVNSGFQGGAGGGHASAGSNGGAGSQGGSSAGSADLITMVFGGGAGCGTAVSTDSNDTSGGAGGGGIVIILTKSYTNNSTVSVNGGNGGTANAKGGCGAGGSVLVVCQTASLGSNTITSLAGTGAAAAGSVGRIAVHHSGTVTGTTNPTFTDVSDPTLVESLGGGFLFNLL